MRRNVVSAEMIDEIAELEAKSLIACLKDPDLCADPKILSHARKFLKDHAIETAPAQLKMIYAEAPRKLPMWEDEE